VSPIPVAVVVDWVIDWSSPWFGVACVCVRVLACVRALQALLDGTHRFALRVYFAVTSPPNSTAVRFHTYSEGWITRPPLPADPRHDDGGAGPAPAVRSTALDPALDPKRVVARDRFVRLSAWPRSDEVLPRCRGVLRQVLGLAAPKIVVRPLPPAFELFGADFILQAPDCGRPERLWLCEVRISSHKT